MFLQPRNHIAELHHLNAQVRQFLHDRKQQYGKQYEKSSGRRGKKAEAAENINESMLKQPLLRFDLLWQRFHGPSRKRTSSSHFF
ncbi:unnamed protein product, partial [Mesorhabditis belari]|uniref:Uncharacterized protein n=1 Tax=Mesorhabditis belari TaxID=2138241 RepID=A0AAF3ENE2_9BILA